MGRSQYDYKTSEVKLVVSDPERRALERILDHLFEGDDVDARLANIVGPHHHQVKTAHRVREKLAAALKEAKPCLLRSAKTRTGSR